MTMMNELLQSLRHALGERHVLTGPDCAPFCTDWRKRYHGQALCVARPANADEVAHVVQLCAAARVAVVPQGGNTGLVGGATPITSATTHANSGTYANTNAAPAIAPHGKLDAWPTGQRPSVIVSLQRLNRIRAVDSANQTLTAEAGCTLQQVQQAAADAGWLYPLRMGSEGSCTIGGNLASNAGGTQVLRYGNARELCLGLEAVTPQGRIWHGLHGLRKNNTGYDLRHLLIGSEGTLGIITAATLKLFALPALQTAVWAAVPSLQAAIDLLTLARQRLDASLTGFEVMHGNALQLVRQHFGEMRIPFVGTAPWHVLLEHSAFGNADDAQTGLHALLEAALEKELLLDATVADSIAQTQALWQIRERIPLAQAAEGLNVKHDIAVPIAAMPAFVQETQAAIAAAYPGSRLIAFGHLGDSNLHYNVQAPAGSDSQAFLQQHEAAINTLVFDAVHRFGGSISAEHGIGQLKRDILPRYQSPVALEMMRAIKHALDPHHIMNPGKVLPDA